MTPQEFITKWGPGGPAFELNERQGAQPHFIDLRNNWLNPPEWTDRVPEVTPLGMDKSPYPDRILPKLGYEKDLAERTLTKLYNQRPAWMPPTKRWTWQSPMPTAGATTPQPCPTKKSSNACWR